MRSLSDTWHGQFSYNDVPGQPENAFVATLLQVGALLTGAAHEIHNHGPHAGTFLTSSIQGDRHGAAITFRKTYDGLSSPASFASVDYDGTLDAEEAEISGTWHIDSLSGRFVMIRANRQAFTATTRAMVPTDAT